MASNAYTFSFLVDFTSTPEHRFPGLLERYFAYILLTILLFPLAFLLFSNPGLSWALDGSQNTLLSLSLDHQEPGCGLLSLPELSAISGLLPRPCSKALKPPQRGLLPEACLLERVPQSL